MSVGLVTVSAPAATTAAQRRGRHRKATGEGRTPAQLPQSADREARVELMQGMEGFCGIAAMITGQGTAVLCGMCGCAGERWCAREQRTSLHARMVMHTGVTRRKC